MAESNGEVFIEDQDAFARKFFFLNIGMKKCPICEHELEHQYENGKYFVTKTQRKELEVYVARGYSNEVE